MKRPMPKPKQLLFCHLALLALIIALLPAQVPAAELLLKKRRTNDHSSLTVVSPSSKRGQNETRRKVEVGVHYETRCRYSLSFFLEGLKPVWQDPELRERLEVSLFPFGNAAALNATEVSEGYRFWHPELEKDGKKYVFLCQHGEEECFGNKIQACAVRKIEDPNKYMPLLFCTFILKQFSTEKSTYECAAQLGIDLNSTRSCVEGPEGDELMFRMALTSRALKPKPKHVPWITLDGVHQGEQADRGDFLGALCAGPLKEEGLKACRGKDGGAEKGKGLLDAGAAAPIVQLGALASISTARSKDGGAGNFGLEPEGGDEFEDSTGPFCAVGGYRLT